jgi:hypothetical protein
VWRQNFQTEAQCYASIIYEQILFATAFIMSASDIEDLDLDILYITFIEGSDLHTSFAFSLSENPNTFATLKKHFTSMIDH